MLLIIDLEDAISLAEKDSARKIAVDYLKARTQTPDLIYLFYPK